MYHAGLGKFVNDNYIKKITTKNKINKNIIFGYVKDNIYYELNEIVEDIDAYINKLETEGCVVYFVKKKRSLEEIQTLVNKGNEHAFYVSREWKDVRKEVLNRDNNECQRCKGTSLLIIIQSKRYV